MFILFLLQIRQMFENNSILRNDTRVLFNLSDCHNLDSIFHSYSESGGSAPLTRIMFPYKAVSLEEKETLLSEKVLIFLTAKIWKVSQPGLARSMTLLIFTETLLKNER